MIETLLSRYHSYGDDQLAVVREHLNDKVFLDDHIQYLERRYIHFSRALRIRGVILKFVPVLSLLFYMLYPKDYVLIFLVTLVLILLSEIISTYCYPRSYFEKIHGNITILKSIVSTL